MVNLIKSELFKFRKAKKNWLIILMATIYAFGVGLNFEKQDREYFKSQSHDYEYLGSVTNDLYASSKSSVELLESQDANLQELNDAIELRDIVKNLNNYAKNTRSAYFVKDNFPNSQTDVDTDLYLNHILLAKALIQAKEKNIDISSVDYQNATLEDYKRDLDIATYMDSYVNELKEEGKSTYDSPFYMSGLNYLAKLFGGSSALIFAILILLTQENYSLEMSSGTFKFSMSAPATRRKIIVSKVLSSLLIACSILIVAIVLPFLYFSLKHGLGDFNYPYWISDSNIVAAIPYILQTGSIFLSYILFLVTSTLALSVIFQSLPTTYIVKVSELIAVSVFFSIVSVYPKIITWFPLFHMQPAAIANLLKGQQVLTTFLVSLLISAAILALTIIRYQHLDLQQREE